MYSDPIEWVPDKKITYKQQWSKTSRWCQSPVFVYCDNLPIFCIIDIDIDMTDTSNDRRGMTSWTQWHGVYDGHIDHDARVPGAAVDGRVVTGHQVGGAGHPHHAGAQLSLAQMENDINQIYLRYLVQILSNKCLFARPGLLVQQNIFSFMIGILIFGPLLIRTFSIY